jgi:hypothetical protein
VYKRGRNKGEAPADSSRRAKTHFRVIRGNGGQMIVRFHNADILTAYEDGHIKLCTNGWHASPTTRSAMNEALCFFGIGGVSSIRKGGYSQTGIHIGRKTYRYYDGMEFAADGTPLTPLKQFTAKRADREETAEFRADIRDSGFVDMFPILYTAAEVPETRWVPRIKDAICSEYGANEWPDIIALVKYPTYYHQNRAQPAHKDYKAALKSFIASHTRTMTKLVDLDETVL